MHNASMRSHLLDDLERLLCLGLRDDARRTGLTEATARVLLVLDPDQDLPMGDLAARLGTVREVVARSLREIERSGAIQVKRGQINVTDQNRLIDWL